MASSTTSLQSVSYTHLDVYKRQSLAHQLRTPLAAARLYAANLGQPGVPDAARARFSEKATGQLRRLEHLIQDVLLFTRGESIGCLLYTSRCV